MDIITNKCKGVCQQFIESVITFVLIGVGTPLFASNPTSGLLVVINGVGNVVNGSAGGTASSVKIVVNDATGPCSTTASVPYKGIVTISWAASNTHSAITCTNISSVDVTALKTITTVQYDSTANSNPPAVATAATNFVAPTTPITNLTLILTGGASPATTHSATVWGAALGVAPLHDANNGSLTTTGIMGGVGAAGLKAESTMRRYGVIPLVS